MKKFSLLFMVALVFGLSSCGSVKKLNSEKAQLEKDLMTCTTSKKALDSELSTLKGVNAKLESEKEMMGKDLTKTKKDLAQIQSIINDNNAKIEKMKRELKAALSEYAGQGVTVTERDGRLYVTLPNQILYQSAKAELDSKGLEVVQVMAKVFKGNQGLNILVEGHTDDQPIKNAKFKDNWDLSVARAVGVVRKLELYGVNPTRLTAAGRGEFMPVAKSQANTAEGRAPNRRTEIIIAPKLQELYKLLNEI